MILRVPDYYGDFECTAGWCKDSCCIGWEINIDEETAEYYESVPGEFGDRLHTAMYENEDGDISFRLGKKKRCPFLNGENLCDICVHLGEELLSEVCTEYPRFSLWYADVQQKCLSLSCEEAGRILFSKEEPVEFVEMELPGEVEFEDEYFDEGVNEEDFPNESSDFYSVREWGYSGADREKKVFLEQTQTEAIAILQDRSKPIELRMKEYLSYLTWIQEKINRTDVDAGESLAYTEEELNEDIPVMDFALLEPTYEQYEKRMNIFKELEVLDGEWESVKKNLQDKLSSSTYNDYFLAFSTSDAYLDRDYENLLVYFTFRYFMNSYYNMDVLSYGKLAVVFTLMLRDMDMLRFDENGGAFSRADRVDTVRIFSKEVEHSEENVEYVREELMFI
ncbi:MAG: flagellin lysine-N-methylase [Lachnospiraceae bacterium]|nr:flagellin lysine-N-methylase [Lachnospiraceae bacterium]